MKFAVRPYFKSMKIRLALTFSLLSIFILFVVFGYLYYFLEKNLDTEALQILDERFLLVADILKYNDQGLENLKNRVENEWISAQHEPLWIQVKLSDNSIWAQSPLYSSAREGDFVTNKRVFNVVNLPKSFTPITVTLRLNRAKERELLMSYSRKMVYLLIITVVFSIFSAFKIVDRETAPILHMSKKIKSITPVSLHRRIKSQFLPEELVPLAESFNEMIKELENSFAQISRFSADIAHELRTPLNALMIKIEVMLEKQRTVVEYQELLESLFKDTFGLSKLIDTLLFLARADHPQRVVHFEKINLNKELQSIVEFYEPLASEKEITLQAFSLTDEVEFFGEKSLFERALGNLIQNAIQYCPPGSAIKINQIQTEVGVIVEVADNGPGISAEHQPHIFNRLYRIESSRSQHSGGLGLGLSIVSSVMKMHGGSAIVQSELGQGTKFQLLFPHAECNRLRSHEVNKEV